MYIFHLNFGRLEKTKRIVSRPRIFFLSYANSSSCKCEIEKKDVRAEGNLKLFTRKNIFSYGKNERRQKEYVMLLCDALN